jgi:two-component system chemotaxis response regulator CheB
VNRDIVTIGASAGSVEILLELVRELPSDLGAALFVVLHLPSDYTSTLPDLLSKRGPLPARHPLHGETIRPGTIYVAPGDMHLQVRPGTIEVVRGPKENGFRPAADALFRTASSSYGPRVIGVVLSGYQDCGTAGMLSIKARGGLAVVQDPATAVAPDMPQSVLDAVEVDHVVHPLELPGLLQRLVSSSPGESHKPGEIVQQLEGAIPGAATDVVCPVCNGVLTETQPGVFEHFRCHVGHAFSLHSLATEQSEQLERALWAAIRALEESAALADRLAAAEKGGELKKRFVEKARTQREQADLLRAIAMHGDRLAPQDGALH